MPTPLAHFAIPVLLRELNRNHKTWQVIRVSPIGLSFFSARSLEVLKSEFYYVVLPTMMVLPMIVGVKKFVKYYQLKTE